MDSPDLARLGKAAQCVVDTHSEDGGQLLVGVSRSRLCDQPHHRIAQRSVLRETRPAVDPQAMRIEAWNMPERVVFPSVGVTRQVAGASQHAQDRGARCDTKTAT
jgi:hypothetical protein